MKTIKLLKILTIAMAFLIVIGFIFVAHKLAEKGTKIKSSSIARSEMVLDFPEKTAVVIGSEGSGVSPQIAALCDEKVYIPIKKAESLNAAAAAAIILWELSKF